MKNPFTLLLELLRGAIATRQRSATLAKLRAENPDCVIRSTDIHDTQLGKSDAILDRAILRQVSMGNFSYVACDSCLNNVEVGNFCSIGPHVQVGLAPHPTRDFVSIYPAFYSNKNPGCPIAFRENKTFDDAVPKTILANDIWIGANVIIPGGITIGTGAIVAAGAVVVKDVPPYAVVGGNPATIIRYRFSEGQINALLLSEWWNWPIEEIRQQVDDFSDIEKFQGYISVKYSKP